jgi:uncharacterized protein
MAESNAELVRRAYDNFNSKDFEAFLALADEDVVIESRLAALEGAYHGHDGARRWWDEFLGVFPDYEVKVHELRDLGDVVLARVTGVGHAGSSEVPLVDPFWHALQWRGGKLVWWRNCRTEEEALGAIAARQAS